jgi:hypothetical protein
MSSPNESHDTSSAAASVVESIPIPWRDGAPLTVELRRGTPAASPVVVVFVNGLGRPRSAWAPVSALLPASYTLLSYDRFGQGDSPPLPPGSPAEWHDGAAAARDLHELLVAAGIHHRRGGGGDDEGASTGDEKVSTGDPSSAPTVVLVGHSIGAAIVRLFLASPAAAPAATTVRAVLLVDPSIVNSDFVSLFPAARDGEPEELTRTREATRRVFHPSAPNREGFDRAAFLRLLPLAEAPPLPGAPFLAVVAHDPAVAFGEDSEKASRSGGARLPCLYRVLLTPPPWTSPSRAVADGHQHEIRPRVRRAALARVQRAAPPLRARGPAQGPRRGRARRPLCAAGPAGRRGRRDCAAGRVGFLGVSAGATGRGGGGEGELRGVVVFVFIF